MCQDTFHLWCAHWGLVCRERSVRPLTRNSESLLKNVLHATRLASTPAPSAIITSISSYAHDTFCHRLCLWCVIACPPDRSDTWHWARSGEVHVLGVMYVGSNPNLGVDKPNLRVAVDKPNITVYKAARRWSKKLPHATRDRIFFWILFFPFKPRLLCPACIHNSKSTMKLESWGVLFRILGGTWRGRAKRENIWDTPFDYSPFCIYVSLPRVRCLSLSQLLRKKLYLLPTQMSLYLRRYFKLETWRANETWITGGIFN